MSDAPVKRDPEYDRILGEFGKAAAVFHPTLPFIFVSDRFKELGEWQVQSSFMLVARLYPPGSTLPKLAIVNTQRSRVFQLNGYISLTRIAMTVSDYARDNGLVCEV